MSLFGSKEKKEIARLKAMLTPEQQELEAVNAQIISSKKKLADMESQISSAIAKLQGINSDIQKQNNRLAELKAQIIETDEAVLLQEFGVYTPHYYYSTSDEYKEKLSEIRTKQKNMVKYGAAVTGSTTWTVNNSKSKGEKMVKDMQKLLLRAFNAECDDAIEHVKFNNVAACEKKISASANAVDKLGKMMGISIKPDYFFAKLDELYLMHEYQQKKQEEKEAAKEARAKQREEAKAMKELEEARKKLVKEQNHYQNALAKINAQVAVASSDAQSELLAKQAELMAHLAEIGHQIEDVDYRQANHRAGYVYIISNIGAFGENVYKIGMTRRLDPMERVDELGDASVPFDFDVHAMIFSEDAPALEAALHNAFADKKLNFVNHRREFFRVSLDEIKEVVYKNYDKTVEFVDIAPAEQYRESLQMMCQN